MNIKLVVTLVARVILLTVASCLFWSALPTVWGWKATTVMSDSMAPSVRAGDIVVAMPVADPAASLGHVILVDDPDHPGRLRLHRLVGLTADGALITRGDANAADDSSPIAPDDVHGLAVIRVPALGMPFVWLREGRWELLLGAAVIGLGLGFAATRRGGAHRVETANPATTLIPSALSVIDTCSGRTASVAFRGPCLTATRWRLPSATKVWVPSISPSRKFMMPMKFATKRSAGSS